MRDRPTASPCIQSLLYRQMRRCLTALAVATCLASSLTYAQQQEDESVTHAIAVEAEFFTVDQDWQVIQNGQGNYMVDMIGFQHISGERLLGIDKANSTAKAHTTVTIPEAGDYALWVRYEYPPFTDTRFRATIEQGGKQIAALVMGDKDKPRYGINAREPAPQYDPSWGAEGLALERLSVPGLKAGDATIRLEAVDQPQVAGVAANRNIDFVYLTSDTDDTWMAEYGKRNRLYPVLDAYRDDVGPRWRVRVTNRSDKPLKVTARHIYNRVPWYLNAAKHPMVNGLAAGETSGWIELTTQDTTHYSLIAFKGKDGASFDVEFEPMAGPRWKAASSPRTLSSDADGVVRTYLPPYPHWGEPVVQPREQAAKVLAHLDATPAPGATPTRALAYGGWIPLGDKTEYEKAFTQLYKAIGMRAAANNRGSSAGLEKLLDVELEPSRAIMAYRNPPTDANIENAAKAIAESGEPEAFRWFDYGDEISFATWVNLATAGDKDAVPQLWRDWLKEHRPGYKATEYWLEGWGALDATSLRPNSSTQAAIAKPKLYVDSVEFYEQLAIDYVAKQRQKLADAIGDHILAGANYSAHPFYYPSIPMYVRWFREGAADYGRHSEYFWQVTQPGPMVNGYIAEHFRSGMRDNPDAVLRQYTMPHSPGNTDKNFLRTAFTHLAHGAKALDYFGIGMNEAFTENHIDHRDVSRYQMIRDVNHTMATVEDVLPESTVVPSRVAILLSDSTERWDWAGVAGDRARHNYFGPDFRKSRLAYHFDRLGIYKALTFAGESPDLLIESDLASDTLGEYDVLYVVGDSLPGELAKPVRDWVEAGGHLVATGGAGKVDQYQQPQEAWTQLLGLASRQSELVTPFFRPRQELPFLKPTAQVQVKGADDAMPVIATRETIKPADGATVLLAQFEGDGPAVVRRDLGKGSVTYIAALPGVAYLWSALQPPAVPDRGPNTHTVPVGFDEAAETLLLQPLKQAGITPRVATSPKLIDSRLIAGDGAYVLPIANYQRQVGQAVDFAIQLPEGVTITKASSAYEGPIDFDQQGTTLTFTHPNLGYGDIVRLDTK